MIDTMDGREAPAWVDENWPTWPDGAPLYCPRCLSSDLDISEVEFADVGYHASAEPPAVLCNDCQDADRDPFVIERIEGVYVALQHPRPLARKPCRSGQLAFAIP